MSMSGGDCEKLAKWISELERPLVIEKSTCCPSVFARGRHRDGQPRCTQRRVCLRVRRETALGEVRACIRVRERRGDRSAARTAPAGARTAMLEAFVLESPTREPSLRANVLLSVQKLHKMCKVQNQAGTPSGVPEIHFLAECLLHSGRRRDGWVALHKLRDLF